MTRKMDFLMRLFKLAFRRKRSREDYFNFQKFQACRIVAEAREMFGLTRNTSVVDYGCGNGGYSLVLAREFQDVTAVDFAVGPVTEILGGIHKVKIEKADLLSYRTDPKDFLFCASVIEHIAREDRQAFVSNMEQNIKPGGFLYLSFPPFYSIIGGHVCAPFHYLPDPVAFYLTKKIKKYPILSYETMCGNWGLHKTTIGEVEKLLSGNGFRIIQLRSRYMPYWYSRLFGRNGFFNWHAEFYCRKIEGGP